MSIIQRIRDKAAWLIFAAIALAMIGFIVTDAFQGGGGGLFNSRSTTIGKVNGKNIEYVEFENRVKQQEQQYPGGMNEMMRQNLQEGVWGQLVEEKLLADQYNELGIFVTDKEIGDVLYGKNPPEQLKRQFTSPETGQYDAAMAYQTIQEFKKRTPGEYNAFIESIISMRMREKYMSLLVNTVYIPKWMLEKSNADNAQLANISYVNVPYTTISDSAVKVTDDDVEDYISKRKEEFKQEESRTIAYTAFSAAPSANDTAEVLKQLTNVRAEFDTVSDVQSFLVRNGGEGLADFYVTRSNMQVPNADTIRSLSEGQVYGPYLDGGSYVMAKMISKRSIPDTVKLRHILISTQNGTPDSVAKRRIDSVVNAINSGADFKAVAAAVSEDPGSKDNGGEYEFTSLQFSNLAKEFAEAAFYGNKGDKKTIKTSFGYHYLEILDHKKIEPAFKVAYLNRPILPSSITESAASGLASQFAGQSRNRKAFDENIDKQKLQKIIASDIKPTDVSIPNLGSSRQFVRWIYEADLGDVSEPFMVDDKYVVGVVTEINKEGTMSAAKARPAVEVLIRNQKKAEQIKSKLGKPATLEAAAGSAGVPIQRADSVGFAAGFIPNVGQELKVIGAAFNKAWQGKVTEPISGTGGVFVIRTESVFARPNPNADIEQQRVTSIMQQRSMNSYRVMEGLRKSAKIKDNRAKFL
jgi:peptidyl-prolyl cis-trans isomerase D